MFYKATDGPTGASGRIQFSWETIQITTYAALVDERKSNVAATFVLDGEGHTNEGWAIVPSCHAKFVQSLTAHNTLIQCTFEAHSQTFSASMPFGNVANCSQRA